MSDPITVWTVCTQCRNVEGWDVRDNDVFVVPSCEVCGSYQIELADYHPDA